MGRRKMDPVRATDRLLVDNRPHWSPQEEAYHTIHKNLLPAPPQQATTTLPLIKGAPPSP